MFPKPLPEAALAQWRDECHLLPQCKIKTLASTGDEGSSGALKVQTEKSVKLTTQMWKKVQAEKETTPEGNLDLQDWKKSIRNSNYHVKAEAYIFSPLI